MSEISPIGAVDEPTLAADAPAAIDSAVARSAIEKLIPDAEVRAACLRLMADSILQANTIRPYSWATTILAKDTGISLNVGQLLAVRLRRDFLGLSVDTKQASPELAKVVKDWSREPFGMLTDATYLRIPHDSLPEVLPVVRDPHRRFVERAATRGNGRTPQADKHASAVVEYISQQMAQPIPQPLHPEPRNGLDAESDDGMAARDAEASSVLDETIALFDRTRNVILYGPPGTGKTYLVGRIRDRFLSSQVGRPASAQAVTGNGGIEADLALDAPSGPQVSGLGDFYRFVTFHQSFAYEEFVEGLKPRESEGRVTYEVRRGVFREICRRAAADPSNNYLLVIDEINRANIAKVFGELITLLEDDKRLGRPNQLTVTLPYSQEIFGVPSNFYVLGTMNTADRSIALLDLALRRRFAFVEMPPRPEVLRGRIVGGVDLQSLLAGLNARVAFALDCDHLIGHSYLMNVADLDGLRFAWERKIMPLLTEYFYGDVERLRQVTGAAFFKPVAVPSGFDGADERWEYATLADDDAFVAALLAISSAAA